MRAGASDWPGPRVATSRYGGAVQSPIPADPDPRLVAALGADLAAAGFTIDGLDAAWGPVAA